MTDVLAFLCAAAALLPAVMTLVNQKHFQVLPDARESSAAEVSVLIPARDEAAGIAATVQAVLESEGVQLEIVVLDDHSQDETRRIVQSIAARDPRVRLIDGQVLPPNWNGKQHACWQLAHAATYDSFIFLDADVRLAPDALRRITGRLSHSPELGLLSLFPWQQTVTLWERMLIPLMHFILLGFLPIARMRRNRSPAFAAGCGQLMAAPRDAYQQCGGHAAIRASRHDGVALPRVFRQHGWSTDIADGQDVATCRMYRSTGQVFRGLMKNATEGIANPRLIGFFTVVLMGGIVLPWIVLPIAVAAQDGTAVAMSVTAIAIAYVPRVINAAAFRQSWVGALLHPLSIFVFLLLQWVALFGSIVGWRPRWRGRVS